MMQRRRFTTLTIGLVVLCGFPCCQAQGPGKPTSSAASEPLLQNLPPGISLVKSTVVAAADAARIGQRLGAKVTGLSNSNIRVFGRDLQINVIRTPSPADTDAVYNTLSKQKQPPFIVRHIANAGSSSQQSSFVVEYVGKNIDEALVTITSYELGIVPKPKQIRYRVTAELATVASADYMACNAILNQALALQQNPQSNDALDQLKQLTGRMKFGNQLVLRTTDIATEDTRHQFKPPAINNSPKTANTTYSFSEQSERYGIPYITATIETTVVDSGSRKAAPPDRKTLTLPNPRWPSSDPTVMALAKQITAGKTTDAARVQAILEWLRPGNKMRYDGPVGSRWGTLKALQQKFGRCWDFSDAFVTLARAANVPTRQVAGWLYGSSGHVWAEYYDDQQRSWIQVDATGGGELACGLYHIPYFTSEDGEMPIVYLSLPTIEQIP